MASSISGSCTTVCLTPFAVFERLPTKGTLIDFSFLCTRKGNAVVLKLKKENINAVTYVSLDQIDLDHSARRLPTHIVNCVLVTKPVRTLNLSKGEPFDAFHWKNPAVGLQYRTCAISNHPRSCSSFYKNQSLLGGGREWQQYLLRGQH